MQQINYSYAPNEIERLFIEKGLESLYKGTLDSYRVRLNNTKTIIEELVQVTQQVKDGILQRGEYVIEVCNEAKELITGESESLEWISISKEFYTKTILSGAKNKTNYYKIIQASKLVLSDNQDFGEQIISKVEQKINAFVVGDSLEGTRGLLSLCDFYNIELLNIGYSKQYLYQYFRTIFVHTGDAEMNFINRFELWKNLFRQEEREYEVIYKILSRKFQFRELKIINSCYEQVNKNYRARNRSSLSAELNDFLETNKQEKLIAIKVDAADHYKAIQISRQILSKDLDLYHSGFNGITNIIDNQAAVISTSNPEKASTEPSNYQLDGFIRGNQSILTNLVTKIRSLRTNNVSEESINKLLSGFRYLRMGTEASALETKLLNYWIGLEYLFTSHIDQKKTIDRIGEFLPICHSVIYVKRKLFAFHKAISRLRIHTNIEEYDDNLEYLNLFATYDIVKNNSSNLLMRIRSAQYQKWAEDPSSIARSIRQHQHNLKWNISRLYRLRNEIVHNAAIKNNIQSNVSHVKYYLTFSLYSILNFLADTPVDINNDGQIAIEDYFITQEIKLANMKGKTIRDYNNITNPMEMFY